MGPVALSLDFTGEGTAEGRGNRWNKTAARVEVNVFSLKILGSEFKDSSCKYMAFSIED